MSTVIGTFKYPNGTAYVGPVRFVALSTPLVASSQVIVGESVSTTSDSDGDISVTLKTGNYTVFAGTKRFTIGVPNDSATYNIKDLATGGLAAAAIIAPETLGAATSTTAGIVKTNGDAADPVVYLKSEVDALLVDAELFQDLEMRFGALKLYNQTTGKYHAVYLTGAAGEMALVIDEAGETP